MEELITPQTLSRARGTSTSHQRLALSSQQLLQGVSAVKSLGKQVNLRQKEMWGIGLWKATFAASFSGVNLNHSHREM